jgi:hypothetical protein
MVGRLEGAALAEVLARSMQGSGERNQGFSKNS